MNSTHCIKFFDKQFQQQIQNGDFHLNPFEIAAMPHLRGRILDFGCGMGNLAIAAAQRGCSVLALDASASAISHIQHRVVTEGLAVEARQADLKSYEITGHFDTVVAIGLLMFFDCPTAFRVLAHLQSRVRVGGIAVVNVLTEGTTYLDMFDTNYCLFSRTELESRFSGWHIISSEFHDFDAPGGKIKSFATVIAQKNSRHVAMQIT